MPLSDIVNVVVITANPGVTAQGFGIPIIVGPVSWGPERTRTYNTPQAVLADGAATDPVVMAANQIFKQTPSVTTVMVGREELLPTQRYAFGVKNVTVGAIYKARLAMPNGSAWTSQVASYEAVGAEDWVAGDPYALGDLVTNDTGKLYTCITAGVSDLYGTGPTGTSADFTDGTVHWMYAGAGDVGDTSNDAIINGFRQAVDALATPALVGVGAGQMTSSLQGSPGSRTMRLLANTAGRFFGVEVLDRARLSVAQDHADPGIATDLAAILLESAQWYGLITVFNSKDFITAAANWVETNKRLYDADSLDTEIATVAETSATDVFKALKNLSLARTHGFYHPANDEFASAAEMGKFFPINPGGDNWRLKTLAGVSVKQYTETEQTNIKAKYANYYAQLGASGGSTNVIQGDGKVFANEYVDVVRFIDWYIANLQADLVNALIQNNKIAYTDLGVSVLEGILRKRNKLGIAAGGIAATPKPVVLATPVADISSTDKQNRNYPGLSSSWTLAGAINKMDPVNVAVAA